MYLRIAPGGGGTPPRGLANSAIELLCVVPSPKRWAVFGSFISKCYFEDVTDSASAAASFFMRSL